MRAQFETTKSVFTIDVPGSIVSALADICGQSRIPIRAVEGDYAFAEVPKGGLCVLGVYGRGESSLERVRSIAKLFHRAAIVVVADDIGIDLAIQISRLGVTDVIDANGSPSSVAARALAHYSGSSGAGDAAFVGECESVRQLRRSVHGVAKHPSTVLILGETGTGKGVLAREIHRLSRRSDGPFVHVDCSALASSLIEAELFGHEKGAFTGATQQRKGRFDAAQNGTLFLDEIGELEPSLQVKLLRVLEDRIYERVGGVRPVTSNARIIAATNVDLAQAVRERRFRSDLYFRLNVVNFETPPLRKRRSDLPLLIEHGLRRVSERLAIPTPATSDGFHRRLAEYAWPGNVRELLNILERCLVQLRVDRLEANDLDGMLQEEIVEAPQAVMIDAENADSLREVLQEVGGNISRASRRLGIPRSTLRYRIQQNGLTEFIPRD